MTKKLFWQTRSIAIKLQWHRTVHHDVKERPFFFCPWTLLAQEWLLDSIFLLVTLNLSERCGDRSGIHSVGNVSMGPVVFFLLILFMRVTSEWLFDDRSRMFPPHPGLEFVLQITGPQCSFSCLFFFLEYFATEDDLKTRAILGKGHMSLLKRSVPPRALFPSE